jgi:hypothetical protein
VTFYYVSKSPTTKHHKTYEVFTAVKIQVEVFWVVTPSGVVVSYYKTTEHHNPEDLDLKHHKN